MKNSILKSTKPLFFSVLQKMILMSGLFLLSQSAFAMQAPEAVVQGTVDRIVSNIQQNRAQYRANSNKLYAMVERELIPALHVQRMSNLILGKGGKGASAAEKKAFADEFKTFMMRTYAAALLDYTGKEKVIYQPVKAAPGADKVTVKATLVASDGQSYPINLYMSNRRDTQWRAYNLEVAGINFVATYRNTFGAIIAKNGVAGLIKELKAKNARTS